MLTVAFAQQTLEAMFEKQAKTKFKSGGLTLFVKELSRKDDRLYCEFFCNKGYKKNNALKWEMAGNILKSFVSTSLGGALLPQTICKAYDIGNTVTSAMGLKSDYADLSKVKSDAGTEELAGSMMQQKGGAEILAKGFFENPVFSGIADFWFNGVNRIDIEAWVNTSGTANATFYHAEHPDREKHWAKLMESNSVVRYALTVPGSELTVRESVQLTISV